MTTFLGLNGITPLSVARGTCVAFGIMGIAMTSQAIYSPVSYASTFGFPPTSKTAQTAADNPFVPAAGGRALASTLGMLGCLYLRQDKAVGMIVLAGSIMPVIDGWCVMRDIKRVGETKAGEAGAEEKEVRHLRKKAWDHWIVVPVCVALGAWMLANGES